MEKKAEKCRIYATVWPIQGRLVIFFSEFNHCCFKNYEISDSK